MGAKRRLEELGGKDNMRFRNAAVLISLLVCLTFAAQPAKANDVLFNDLLDTITVTSTSGSAPTIGILLGCQTETVPTDICKINLTRPGQHITGATGLFAASAASYQLSEDAGKQFLSDFFASTVTSGTTAIDGIVVLEFDSVLAEVGPVPCIFVACNAQETGAPQQLGTITWSGGLIDTISIESDKEPGAAVPEPASLILFGSGLVMAGGFLRRRRRLGVTPSV
jgi:PEP-CTERM motif-containing protein